MIDKAMLLAQLDALLAEHGALRARARHDDLSDLELESLAFVVRAQALIDRLAPGTRYSAETAAIEKMPAHIRIPMLVGSMRALHADVSAGWTTTIVELVHSEDAGDLLDQADELLSRGYKDAAAVIAGSVLEQQLKLLAIKHAVAIIGANQSPAKADTINADLVKASAYGKTEQKMVTALLGRRNEAAHGDYGKYTGQDVGLMITGIRQFIVANPA